MRYWPAPAGARPRALRPPCRRTGSCEALEQAPAFVSMQTLTAGQSLFARCCR